MVAGLGQTWDNDYNLTIRGGRDPSAMNAHSWVGRRLPWVGSNWLFRSFRVFYCGIGCGRLIGENPESITSAQYGIDCNPPMITVFRFSFEYKYKLMGECLSWGDIVHCRRCDFEIDDSQPLSLSRKRIASGSVVTSDQKGLSPAWARI